MLAMPSLSIGQETQSATRAALQDMDALFASLSQDDWRERERAREALIEAGNQILPQLRQFIAQSANPEARKGAQLALDRIEENTRLGPSKITLDFDNAPLPQVFEALGRQEGFQLRWMDPRLTDAKGYPNISVHLHSVSYWDALKALKERGGEIQEDHLPGEMWLRSGSADPVEPPTIIQGPFLVRVTNVDWSRHLLTANPADVSRKLSVSGEIQAEPKLRLLNTEVSVTAIAFDVAGKAVCTPEPNAGKPWSVTHGLGREGFLATLSPAAGVEPKSLTLEGKVRFRVLVQSSPFEVPDPMTMVKDAIGGTGGFTRQIGGVSTTLGYFRQDETGDAKLILSVSRDGRDDAHWDALCGVLAGSPVKLLAGDGSVIFEDWLSQYPLRDDHVEFQAFVPSRDKIAVPAKLVWDIPTKYRDFDVPFEFKGVPVP